MFKVVLVDQNNQEVGEMEKRQCHLKGKKHQAFSVWVFNKKGQTLIQKRSNKKMLWPGFWSNSCCSHPTKGEKVVDAAQRRLKTELGFSTNLKKIYKFEYKKRFKNIGTEHELCWVLAGRYDGVVKPDPKEVKDYRWISLEKLKNEAKKHPKRFTPWMRMELEEILKNFSKKVKND